MAVGVICGPAKPAVVIIIIAVAVAILIQGIALAGAVAAIALVVAVVVALVVAVVPVTPAVAALVKVAVAQPVITWKTALASVITPVDRMGQQPVARVQMNIVETHRAVIQHINV